MTHYKQFFNPDYLGAYALEPGQEMVLIFDRFAQEAVKNADGREDQCLVAHFREDVKPMILNATNCKIIHKLYATPHVENWVGKAVQIYAAKVKAFGSEVEALRIRPFLPKQGKEKLSADRFAKMLESITAGKFTIEQAKDRFDLTAKQVKAIETQIEIA